MRREVNIFMKRRTAVVIISFLLVTTLAAGGVALNYYKKAENLENALSISHHHDFNELVTGMSELDTALQKSLYATSPTVMSAVCTDVFGKAMTAQMSLGSLPFSTQELEKTAGFISRVGDYAYTLSKNGRAYSEEEAKNLKQLSETATALSQNLQSLQQEITDGGLDMDQLFQAERKLDEIEESTISDSLSGNMRLIEEEFPEIPSLIYDGPFSEHITDAEPKFLDGRSEVSELDAKRAAAKFLGTDEAKLQSLGKSAGKLPCYYFSTDYITIEVTVQGGVVVNFLSSHEPDSESIKAEDAMEIAKKFLKERGYESMRESYHMTQGGICTINFAYEQEGVVCYPDLIKVSVSLSNGMVVGFEAAGYISSHTERQIPAAAVSREKAQEQVGELTVDSYRLCIIPTPGKHEKLSHEYVCSNAEGSEFIIYVDAESGQQEKILILLEDENGSLTI